jgi:hypothetical protein
LQPLVVKPARLQVREHGVEAQGPVPVHHRGGEGPIQALLAQVRHHHQVPEPEQPDRCVQLRLVFVAPVGEDQDKSAAALGLHGLARRLQRVGGRQTRLEVVDRLQQAVDRLRPLARGEPEPRPAVGHATRRRLPDERRRGQGAAAR